MNTPVFTEAQLQKAEALAGDLSLAPTEEDSLKGIAIAVARAEHARTYRNWPALERALDETHRLKRDHVRLFGKRV